MTDRSQKPRLELTVTQYAKREGVNRATVWRWIRKGAVAITRKGRKMGVRVVVTD